MSRLRIYVSSLQSPNDFFVSKKQILTTQVFTILAAMDINTVETKLNIMMRQPLGDLYK